ncbi:MAG TPA: thioredoxin family protein [Chthoniobacterales bacterium]
MPTIASDSMPAGTPAPDFSLPDVVTGRTVSLADFAGRPALLVMFICAHCPYVVHVRAELVRLARAFPLAGFVAISSNDAVQYPGDAPEKLREMAVECGFPFPMLYDESQEVARAYTAACTPDFFLFDRDQKLAYRGRLDDSTPGNGKLVTGADLRVALEFVLAGKPGPQVQAPSLGCSIKWK